MVDDVEALSLVRECRELEERYKSNQRYIRSANEPADGLDIVNPFQQERPWHYCHIYTKCHQTLVFAQNRRLCLKKFWDHALDHRASVIKGMKKMITYPDHPPRKCPLCNTADLDQPIYSGWTHQSCTNHTKNDDNSWCTLLHYHGPHFLQSCMLLTTIAYNIIYYIIFVPHFVTLSVTV